MNLLNPDPFELLEVFKPTECDFFEAPLSPDYGSPHQNDGCEAPLQDDQDDNSSSSIYSPGKQIILTKVFKKKTRTSCHNVKSCLKKNNDKKINKHNKKIKNNKKSKKKKHREKMACESAAEDSDDIPLSEIRKKYPKSRKNIERENSKKISILRKMCESIKKSSEEKTASVADGKRKFSDEKINEKEFFPPQSNLKSDCILTSFQNPIWKDTFIEDPKKNVSLKKIKIWYEKLDPISASESKFFSFEYNNNDPYVKFFQEEELISPVEKKNMKLIEIKPPKSSAENDTAKINDCVKKGNNTPEDCQNEKYFPILNNGFMSPSISDNEEGIQFPNQCRVQCGNPLKTQNAPSDQIPRNEDPEIVDDTQIESEVHDDDDPPSFHDYGDEASVDLHGLEPNMDSDISEEHFTCGSTITDLGRIKREIGADSPDLENLESDSSKERFEPFHNHEHGKCKVLNLTCPACDELCYKMCDYRFHSILHTREEILFKKVPPLVSISDCSELADVLCGIKSEKNVQRFCPECKKAYTNQRTMMLHYKMQHLVNN